jgi:aspartate-semialdehyde dehydrogenase
VYAGAMASIGRVHCAIFGARGLVAQRYLQRLINHNWLIPVSIIGSNSTKGKNICDLPWSLDEIRPDLPNIIVQGLDNMEKLIAELKKEKVEIIFSAIPDDAADLVEEKLANAGFLVISHAMIHRMKNNVPLIIPEVNSDHLRLIKSQNFNGGNLISCCNCMVVPIALTLFPLFSNFKLRSIGIRTEQSLSGGGRKMLINGRNSKPIDSVIIGEDESIIRELKKIFGSLENDIITHNDIDISAQCSRVNNEYGHLAEIEIIFENEISAHEVIQVWQNSTINLNKLNLPSSSKIINFITGKIDIDNHRWAGSESREPGVDLNAARGVSLGEIEISDKKLRFKVVADNTIRGAAGYGVLIAELLLAEGIHHVDKNHLKH